MENSITLNGFVRVVFVGVVLFSTVDIVHAQQRPDAGRVLESIKEPPKQPKAPPEIGVPPSESPTGRGDGGLRVKVKKFQLTGNTEFTDAQLLPLLDYAVGKELTVNELQQAATVITIFYRHKGYLLTQAYLPIQEISEGVVTIAVLVGQTGQTDISLSPDARISEDVAKKMLQGLESGTPIKKDSLERRLLLLNDIPGVTVRSVLKPSQTVGAADIAVNIEKDRNFATGSIGIDNWGNRFVGAYRMIAAVELNNPSRRGDLLSFQGITTEQNGLHYARLAYVFPVGFHGTKIGVSYSNLEYKLIEDFKNLDAHGDAQIANVTLSHPIFRTRDFSVYGHLAFDDKDLVDHIDSVSVLTEKETRLVTATLSGEWRDRLGGGSVNTFALGYAGGDLNIVTPGAKAADADTTGRQTDGSFQKGNLSLSRWQSLSTKLGLFLSLSGQYASKNLDSSEKFSLGGPTGVRAYPTGEATADQGYVVTAELRGMLFSSNYWGDVTLIGFADSGWVDINKNLLPTDSENDRNLTGYGVGLGWRKENNLFSRLDIAWRGDKIPTSDDDKRPRIWFQLTTRF